MPLGLEAVLLPDLALKHVGLRVGHGQRRIGAGERRAPAHGQRVVGVEGYQGDQARRVALGYPEPRAEPGAALEFRAGPPDQFRARATRAPPPRECWCRWPEAQMRRRAHGVGKSCATASVQAPRRRSGVARPSHSEIPMSRSGGMITPAFSRIRLPFGPSAARGRPSTTRKHEPRQAEECEQQAAEEHSRGRDMTRVDRGAHDAQLAEERAEGRASGHGEHPGDEYRGRLGRHRWTSPSPRRPFAPRQPAGCCPRSGRARPLSGCCSKRGRRPPTCPRDRGLRR